MSEAYLEAVPMAEADLTFVEDMDAQYPEAVSEPIERESRLRRWKTKIILGAAATSMAVTLATDPVSETKDAVMEAAPWVGTGVLASEIGWIGGAAMMAAAVGDKVGNPLTLKRRMPEIAERAQNSNLFKAGFWVNTAGAVGDFAVLSAGVMHEMPVKSWGVLGFTLMDLGVTVAVRKAIHKGIMSDTSEDVA